MANKVNKKTPKVSIIITVKNSDKTIMECLDSMLKQTLEEIEMVFVDGNSTDNTIDILQMMQKKDDRIKIFTQERPGIGAAKNYGIEHATGEYITFLDGDDLYLDETALAKMYEAAKEYNVKICGALRQVKPANGEAYNHPLHRPFLVGFPKGRLFNYKDVQYDYHFHSYIYDRKMIMDCNARFAEIRVYDDTRFTICAFNAAKKFFVVPVELYLYRCHEGYEWNADLCKDAIESLAVQLKTTDKLGLDMCHYFTLQRINYEYGRLFEKRICEGNFELLKMLIDDQESINQDKIMQFIGNNIDPNITAPMNFPDDEIRFIEKDGEKKIIFSPLYNLIHHDTPTAASIDYEYFNVLENVYNSKTFKTGNFILKVPRKIYHIFKK